MKKFNWNDKMTFGNLTIDFYGVKTQWSRNITTKNKYYTITLDRKVTKDDISQVELDVMPGFRLTWNLTTKLSGSMYSNDDLTKEFVR